MLYVIKWVLLAICSALGMALIPTMSTTGFILAFGCFLVLALDIARQFIDQGGYMKKYNINMYQVPIIKIYRTKQYWSDWLKYRLPIPKKITPVILKNLLGGYK